MRRTITLLLILLIGSGVAVAQNAGGESDSVIRGRYRLSVDLTLAYGANDFAPRAMQLAVVNSLSWGKYLSGAVGIGLRHSYVLTAIDKNIYGYGEEDQLTYSDRLLLPFFVRVKGVVPVGRFSWMGTGFTPYAQMTMGYAVDMQQSARERTVSGVFMEPALGLDMRLNSGSYWSLTTGVGFQGAQYRVVDHHGEADPADATVEMKTGNAVSINIGIAYIF